MLRRRLRRRVALLVILCVAAGFGTEPGSSERIRLRTLAGEEVVIDPELPGDPLVIHFWASWCPSCVEELPHLDQLVLGACDGRVRVVAVNLVEGAESVARTVRERGLSLEVARDPDGQVFRQLAGGSMPANYIRSPSGVSRSEGPMSKAGWTKLLQELGCQPESEHAPATAPE